MTIEVGLRHKERSKQRKLKGGVGGGGGYIHCCKSSERFGLKCEFSLVSNKYIPYIGLV